MAQMTLSSLNYGAPITTRSTGLGRGFSTPQRAKVERPMQFQNMDSMALQNFSKPKANTIQPFGQPIDIGNPDTNVFASPDMLNTYNSSLQANLSANPIKNPRVDERKMLDMLQRVANTGASLEGTQYGALLDKSRNDILKMYGMQNNSGIPKAGQALSEPYKPNKVAGASNSSFDYRNFTNVLNSIRDEQNFYKELSDPNFKTLSEEEMAKQADERFNKEYSNKTWKDLYSAPNLAAVEKERQQAIKDFNEGKGSKARIGFSSPEYALSAAQQGAADLFSRARGGARNSILFESRQRQAAKQYFDSEEGKKRLEAGKKLLDFYGTKTGLADNTSYLYGMTEAPVELTNKGASFTFYDMPGAGILGGVNPTTEYQKRYADELKKQGEGVSKRLTLEEHQKIRDTITNDFNKSVGFTRKFIPFKFNKFNEDARAKSYFENPMKNPMTGQTYDDATLKRLFTQGALNYDPTQKYKSVFERHAERVKR